MTIHPRPSLAAVIKLLEESDLPTSDLNATKLSNFYGLSDNRNLVGLIGMEICNDTALLRSLVVEKNYKGQGLGKVLVEHLEEQAQLRNVYAIYLLTTTAANFFAKLKYQTVERATVPDSIQQTKEFSSICPDSATVMRKKLVRT